jgi:hypothetical protein
MHIDWVPGSHTLTVPCLCYITVLAGIPCNACVKTTLTGTAVMDVQLAVVLSISHLYCCSNLCSSSAAPDMDCCSTISQDCTADPGSTLNCTAQPGGTPGGTYSCMVPVQLHSDGFSGPKGALEGQGAGGAVLKVWTGHIHTQ